MVEPAPTPPIQTEPAKYLARGGPLLQVRALAFSSCKCLLGTQVGDAQAALGDCFMHTHHQRGPSHNLEVVALT